MTRLASYRSPKTVVRRSRIIGRGLFADATIGKGEIVCVKGGHLLTKVEFANHKSAANEADLQIADDLFLAPVTEAEFEDVMMFLNHSCEPNVGVQGQIVFVALRDIVAGEGLKLDYATSIRTPSRWPVDVARWPVAGSLRARTGKSPSCSRNTAAFSPGTCWRKFAVRNPPRGRRPRGGSV